MNLSIEAKVAIAVATGLVVLIVGRYGPGVAKAHPSFLIETRWPPGLLAPTSSLYVLCRASRTLHSYFLPHPGRRTLDLILTASKEYFLV